MIRMNILRTVLLGGVTLSLLFSNVEEAAANTNYKDVPTKHWAYQNILEATKLGLLKGNDNGTFAPDKNVSRAELAQLLARYFDEDVRTKENFSDVADNFWATPAIEELIALNIINPSDYKNGKFEPNKAMTRIEMAKWFTKALAVKQASYNELEQVIRTSQHTLIPVTEFYKGGLNKADYGYAGIMLGTGMYTGYEDGSFKPSQNTKRSEVATLAIRFNNLLGKEPTSFKGLNEIVEVSETGSNMVSATKLRYSVDYYTKEEKHIKNVLNKPLTLNNNVGTFKLHRLIFVDSGKNPKEALNNSIYAKMFFNEKQRWFNANTIYMYVDQSVVPNKVLDHMTLANSSYNGFINAMRLTENVNKYGFVTLPEDTLKNFFTVGKEKRYWTEEMRDKNDSNYSGYETNDKSKLHFYSTY